MRTALLGVFLLAATAPAATDGHSLAPGSPFSVPIGGRVLDLAFLDDDHVVVLLVDAVALYERDGTALRRVDHLPLEANLVVRAPAGLIVAHAGEAAFWVSTNLAEGAVLFTIDGGRLQESQRAAALPFPGAPQGARFRPGTNLIDVTVPMIGSGPHLRAGAGEEPWSIALDGRFTVAGSAAAPGPIGSAAAPLWPGRWIASSASPPGAGDSLSVIADGSSGEVIATFPAPAMVTAIAARVSGDRAFVAAALADGGSHRLALMEVNRDAP